MKMKQFSRKEEHDMWSFLLKEIVDPITGIIEKDRVKARGLSIWEKFRSETGMVRSATSLRKRYSMPGFPTPESLNFDVDERVKLSYALGIPVSDSFLNELLENADVDLDEYSCIVRYKDRRAGGLELRQFITQRKRKRDYSESKSQEKKIKDELEPGFSGVDLTPMQNILNSLITNSFKVPEEESTSKRIPREDEDPSTGIPATNFLENMESLITDINSADLEDVRTKIEAARENGGDKKIPIEKVKLIMEATLAMMGF